MFNYRPDTPWIYLSPEPVDDDPPGFRLAPDGSVADTQRRSFGFGSSAYGPDLYGTSADSTGYGLPYLFFQAPTDPVYTPFPFASAPRHPFQKAFDQLAGIYAGLDALKQQALGIGSVAADNDPHLQGSSVVPQLSNPWGVPPSRMGSNPFTGGDNPFFAAPTSLAPLNPLTIEPDGRLPPMAAFAPAAPRLPSATEGEVISDAASDDGLRDGQQYAQYRPPMPIRGLSVGVDGEGRDILIRAQSTDDRQVDPFEVLKQKGYPRPPADPSNGSAIVDETRKLYSRDRPNYHRFEFKDALCDLGTPGCSVEAAYEALLRHAVPGGARWGVPIQHGQVSPVSFKGIPGGRVQTSVDPESNSVIHHTVQGHMFHDGYLQRQIVVENGKVYVRTSGEGNNMGPQFAAANNLMSRSVFEDSTAKIRAALQSPKGSDVEWPR